MNKHLENEKDLENTIKEMKDLLPEILNKRYLVKVGGDYMNHDAYLEDNISKYPAIELLKS